MKCRAGMLASAAAAGIVAASAFALLQSSDGSSSDGDSARSNAAARLSDDDPALRGCRERVEGGKIVPNRTVDTVIGPMAFTRLPIAYREEASRPDSELKPYPPVGMPTMKVIGVLRAGARVTLTVPRPQRRWMKVVYDYPDHSGGYAITLQACNRLGSPRGRRRECGWRPDLACRWRYTQFSGGFGVDFARAPRRGACAQLVVRVKGTREPLREFLFDPEPGMCGGGPDTIGGTRLPDAPTAIANACAQAATRAAFRVLCPDAMALAPRPWRPEGAPVRKGVRRLSDRRSSSGTKMGTATSFPCTASACPSTRSSRSRSRWHGPCGRAAPSRTCLRPASYFVLASLLDGPLHGYAISTWAAELSDGDVRLTAGTVYGALDRMTAPQAGRGRPRGHRQWASPTLLPAHGQRA